jgi:hypothetical protein
MRELQCDPESDSDGEIIGQNRIIEPPIGWQTEVEFSQYRKNKDVDAKIIKLANEKNSLQELFRQFHVKFTESYSPSGWTHKARCPFKNHRDNTPSFGFNPQENRFNCLGCQKSGGPTQFVAYMENVPQIEAAKKLLKNNSSLQDAIIEIENRKDRTDEILIEFSSMIRDFILNNKDNPNALQFAESVTWSLDVYLSKNVMYGSIVVDNLEARIFKLKEHLNSFGKSNE